MTFQSSIKPQILYIEMVAICLMLYNRWYRTARIKKYMYRYYVAAEDRLNVKAYYTRFIPYQHWIDCLQFFCTFMYSVSRCKHGRNVIRLRKRAREMSGQGKCPNGETSGVVTSRGMPVSHLTVLRAFTAQLHTEGSAWNCKKPQDTMNDHQKALKTNWFFLILVHYNAI